MGRRDMLDTSLDFSRSRKSQYFKNETFDNKENGGGFLKCFHFLDIFNK